MKKIHIITKNEQQLKNIKQALHGKNFFLDIHEQLKHFFNAAKIEQLNKNDLLIFDTSTVINYKQLINYIEKYHLSIIAITKLDKIKELASFESINDVFIDCPSVEEITYRIEKIINLTNSNLQSKNMLDIADLIIDLEKYTVAVDNKIIDLTFKEFELLAFLASNIDKPLTRDSLLDQVWGYDYIGGYRTVDVHIRRIRAKIEQNYQYIQTVRNIGYRFINPNKQK
jgi:DNA-binding response OmpR family regulator